MFFLDRFESCDIWQKVESMNRCNSLRLWIRSSFEFSRNVMMTAVEFFFFIDCWLLVFWIVSIFYPLACCHHAYRRFYIDLNHSLKKISFTIKKNLVEHDEMSSISKSETQDSLQISIHLLNKNHDYWDDEIFTCVNLQFNRSLFAFIRRIDSENSFTRESATFLVFTSHASIVIEIVS
jgi:hypothetical protein